MKAMRQVIPSNGVPYLQIRSIESHIAPGKEKEERKKERKKEGRKEGRKEGNDLAQLSMEP